MLKIKNRLMALLMAGCLLLTMAANWALPATAAAPKNATEISTAKEFLAIASGNLGGNYIQTADIDLTGWSCAPIGTLSAPFTGIYDGNGYTISGLNLNSNASYQGLFGVNAGTIRYVTLDESCSITGSSFVGAIAGKNTGTIENCISYASVSHKAANENGTSYKIMSQNLLNKADDARRPVMVTRIKAVDPDLLLLQESNYNTSGSYNWDEYLKNNLNAYTYIGQKRGSGSTDYEGTAVAFKTSRFNKVAEGIFWLSPNPDAAVANQNVSWDAACRRATQWVVVQDKSNGQQIALFSNHLDHMGETARKEGAKLVAQRVNNLKKQYPNAIFVVGGDLNCNIASDPYATIDDALDGNLEDVRYFADTVVNDVSTMMDTTTLAVNANKRAAIDHIFVDIDKAEVEHFEVRADTPNNIAPSDHCGLYVKIEPIANNYVGAGVGFNSGTVSRVIAGGKAELGSAEGRGTFLGANTNKGIINDCHSKDGVVTDLVGTAPKIGTLPAQADQYLAKGLGKAFVIEDGKYALIDNCSAGNLVKVEFNGVGYYDFEGELLQIGKTGTTGERVFVDGEPFSGSGLIIPEDGVIVSVARPVTTVTSAVSSGDYTVSSISDWNYLYNHLNYFKSRDITIHLLCDLNLSNSGFNGFVNSAFSFDGHGHTISNYGTSTSPKSRGIFTVSSGEMGMEYIRNVTVKNSYVTSGNAAILYMVICANAGLEKLPHDLVISDVTIENCTLNSGGGESCGLILSRYGVADRDYTVTLQGCTVRGSTLNANQKAHMGFLVGKLRPGGDNGTSATYEIRDCCVTGNTLTNGDLGASFACGSTEGKAEVHFTNVGIFNNTMTVTKGAYLNSSWSSSANLTTVDKVLIDGNTINGGAYLVSCGSATTKSFATINSIYIDSGEKMTEAVEGETVTYGTISASDLQSGKIGYDLNASLQDYYWAKDGSFYKIADQKGQVRLVTVRNGSSVSSQYANGGASLGLPAPSMGSYRVTEGNGSVSGTTLTISTDRDTVVAACASVTSVSAAVSAGDYTVSNLNEWMFLFNNRSRFQNRNVTIHLLCDLDLSNSAASSFTSFENPAFSFNGHGHTISNWGKTSARMARAGFFYATTGAGGMNFIKNVNFKNCHTGGFGGNAGIVFSAIQGNGGLEGLPTNFTLENVKIDGCTMVSSGESVGMLLGRYGVSNTPFTVNIINCSVTNCSLDAGGSGHKAMLVGKPRAAGAAATYNITDCYVGNNTITNGVQGSGAVFGTAEDSATTVRMNNVGVVGNTITTSNDGAYIGYSDYSKVYIDNILMDSNTVNASKKYLVAYHNGGAGDVGLGTIYSDVQGLTATVEEKSIGYTATPALVRSGEAAYQLNKRIGDASIYWGMTNGKNEATSWNKKIAKIGLWLENGNLVKTLYANGESKVSLAVAEDPDATFEALSGGTMAGNQFTVPAGGGDVAVRVGVDDPNVFLPNYGDAVTTVTSVVTKGTYTISNVEEWMYVYEHADYFAGTDVILVLTADLDLSVARASTFKGFEKANFSLDGAGHTLKNWTVLERDTAEGNALFREYLGDSVRNLTIDNFKVGGGYGRGLLVGNYTGTNSLQFMNVHIKNSLLDATVAGNQMGLFMARAANNAVNGARISITNCSVENTSMENSCGGSINNAGFLIGSAYKNFQYKITNVLVRDSFYHLETGAAGVAIGAAENAPTTLTMENVGLFNCSITTAQTNQYPAVFVGEILGGAEVSYINCMAGRVKDSGGKNLAMVKHSGATVAVTAEKCYVDFTPRMIQTTDNIAGETKVYEGELKGVTALDAKAFIGGAAAWEANKAIGSPIWLCGPKAEPDYPSPIVAEGFAAPFKVSFGDKGTYYTNGKGTLCTDAYGLMHPEEGVWYSGTDRVSETLVFKKDSNATLMAHNFNRNKATAVDSEHHRVNCSNYCGASIVEKCTFGAWTHTTKNGEHIHQRSCVCGNKQERICVFKLVSKSGTHAIECTTCGYVKESGSCTNTLTHIPGTNTHCRVCSVCGYTTDPVNCTMTAGTVKEAKLGEAGSITKTCTKGCGNTQVTVLNAIGDVNGDASLNVADAALLLRVLSGALLEERIDIVAANTYTADGITEENGLTVADVMEILKYVVSH